MHGKIVSVIMLSLLVTSALALAFNVQPVTRSGTVYVRADGSTDSPSAPTQRNTARALSVPPQTEWNKTYGGTGYDQAWALVQTVDGGYTLAGDTNSFGASSFDFWLVKTDSSGNMQWNKTYGGTGTDEASDLVQTVDGGYALAGCTYSFGDWNGDFWLVKTDSSGNVQWSQTYGGTGYEYAFALVQTVDGGYALAGTTESFGAGFDDAWLVKLGPEGPFHDVAATNVAPSKTVVGQGFSATINVTVANQGSYPETFNAAAYANTTIIASQNVTLPAGNSTTVTLTWNTTGFAYGNYTLSAYAWSVPGETNTANNNFTGGTVKVTIPGDINGDGTVNKLDVTALDNAFFGTPGSSNWNPNADINGDGTVDIYDAIILSGHFNQHYP